MTDFFRRLILVAAHEVHRHHIQDCPANCRDCRRMHHSCAGHHHDCHSRACNRIYSDRTHGAWAGIRLGSCVASSFTEIDQLHQFEISQRARGRASSAAHWILRGAALKEKEPKKPDSIFDWRADPTRKGLRLLRLTASRECAVRAVRPVFGKRPEGQSGESCPSAAGVAVCAGRR